MLTFITGSSRPALRGLPLHKTQSARVAWHLRVRHLSGCYEARERRRAAPRTRNGPAVEPQELAHRQRLRGAVSGKVGAAVSLDHAVDERAASAGVEGEREGAGLRDGGSPDRDPPLADLLLQLGLLVREGGADLAGERSQTALDDVATVADLDLQPRGDRDALVGHGTGV